MKQIYESPRMDIKTFAFEDILTTSTGTGDGGVGTLSPGDGNDFNEV